ncbi:MAG: LamG domain-containing protein [Polyangiaceae bacterium]
MQGTPAGASGSVAGASSSAGAAASSGAAGMAAGGSSTGGSGVAGSAGGATGGSAGAAAGAASGGTAGAAGGAAGASSGGSGGSAGAAGGGVGGSSGGMGGAMDCAGHAVSLSANGTGTASDSAKARVEIDLKTDLPLGNSNRTIEVWAYMKDSDWTANTNTLFFYGPGNSARNADGFGLDFGAKTGSTGTIDPFTNAIFDNDNQSSGVTTTSAQWVHFAMTWNGTAVMAYVNGVLKSTKASSTSQTTLMTGTSVFTLGGYPSENAYFAGLFDELSIWSVARSATDIMGTMHKTLVGNEAGLVGYWPFNEASGTTAADAVTTAGHTAHNGTLMAASAGQNPTFVLPTPPSPVTCP